MDGKVTNIKYFKICNNKYPRRSPFEINYVEPSSQLKVKIKVSNTISLSLVRLTPTSLFLFLKTRMINGV